MCESSYLLARWAVGFAQQLALSFAFVAILYPMVGMRGADDLARERAWFVSPHLLRFWAVMLLLVLAGNAFSSLVAAVAPSQQAALNVYSTAFQTCMFFSGYSIPVHQVPVYWRWFTDVSFARWAFEALLLNELEGYDAQDDAAEWLEYWGCRGRSYVRAIGCLALCVLGLHVLAWAAVRYISFERR